MTGEWNAFHSRITGHYSHSGLSALVHERARVGERVNRVDCLVASNRFDAREAQCESALVSRTRLNGIERDFEHGIGLHFTIAAVIRDRLLFEMLGQLGDLDVGQSAVGFSNRQQFARGFVAHGEGIIAQDMIAFAVAEFRGDHDDVERRQFLF